MQMKQQHNRQTTPNGTNSRASKDKRHFQNQQKYPPCASNITSIVTIDKITTCEITDNYSYIFKDYAACR